MSLDSDIALLGTGIAPLVVANQLLSQGYQVLLLNPDPDFFLEDSELSLDPFWPLEKGAISPRRLKASSSDKALEILRPGFPGPIEFWADRPQNVSGRPGASGGFHDVLAPHVRERGRLWISGPDPDPEHWDLLENLFVEGEDWDLNPQILEGIQSTARFPGASAKTHAEHCRAVYFQKFCDWDARSYRTGLLEFVRERLGPERVICNAGNVELMPGGVRFSSGGKLRTARIASRICTFWTPRLTQWVFANAKERGVQLLLPRGVRLWEEWSLVSREPLDHRVVGSFKNLMVWADVDGAPTGKSLSSMTALLAGPLVDLSVISSKGHGLSWADRESFASLKGLCCEFLNWDYYSVRSMRPRALFEWPEVLPPSVMVEGDPGVQIVGGCDGSLVEVVQRAQELCESMISELSSASEEPT